MYADEEQSGAGVGSIFRGMESVLMAKKKADEELEVNRMAQSKTDSTIVGLLKSLCGGDERKWSHRYKAAQYTFKIESSEGLLRVIGFAVLVKG